MPGVMIPTSGGINNQRVRKAPNLINRTTQMGAGGESDAARPLTGQVRNDWRVDKMEGEQPWIVQIPTYNISDQSEACMPVDLMATMICPRVVNANKTNGMEGMRARSLPVNGNKPGLAWTQFDLDNQNTASKLLTNGSIYDQISSNPAFARPRGNFMVAT